MRRAMLTALPLALLVGCVSAETAVVTGVYEGPAERPPTFCGNYAEQTYYNVFEDLYDDRDSFGADAFARSRARRAADAAYERCLSGRTN